MELKASLPPLTLTDGLIEAALGWIKYWAKLPNITSAESSEKPEPGAILFTGRVPPGCREAFTSS
jgi:hypothetical protein